MPAGGRFLKPSQVQRRQPASPLQHRPVAGFVPGEDHNPDYRRVPQETTLSTHTCSWRFKVPWDLQRPPEMGTPGQRTQAPGTVQLGVSMAGHSHLDGT